LIPKGLQNTDAIIEACRKALAALDDGAASEDKEIVTNVIGVMEKLKPQFFVKTNLAVPVTNACLKEAAELQRLASEGDLSNLSEVLARLQSSVENLLKRAKMEGIALT